MVWTVFFGTAHTMNEVNTYRDDAHPLAKSVALLTGNGMQRVPLFRRSR
jgi:hypothetical protein